jgi:chromosome segregation ATPase
LKYKQALKEGQKQFGDWTCNKEKMELEIAAIRKKLTEKDEQMEKQRLDCHQRVKSYERDRNELSDQLDERDSKIAYLEHQEILIQEQGNNLMQQMLSEIAALKNRQGQLLKEGDDLVNQLQYARFDYSKVSLILFHISAFCLQCVNI